MPDLSGTRAPDRPWHARRRRAGRADRDRAADDCTAHDDEHDDAPHDHRRAVGGADRARTDDDHDHDATAERAGGVAVSQTGTHTPSQTFTEPRSRRRAVRAARPDRVSNATRLRQVRDQPA
jgi:hypothetical protein